MDPKDYTGKEWTDLLREMNARQIKNAMKGGYRRVAKKVTAVAQRNLMEHGPSVQGDTSDWLKGVRSWIYPKGDGFLITVMPRRGKREMSYHKNRRYGKTITRGAGKGVTNNRKLPVLMWAEDGTEERQSGGNVNYVYTGNVKWGSRHGSAYKLRKKALRSGGRKRGKMPAYHFLDKSEAEGRRIVESDLNKDLEATVMKAAKKAGWF